MSASTLLIFFMSPSTLFYTVFLGAFGTTIVMLAQVYKVGIIAREIYIGLRDDQSGRLLISP